jgi:hypothetical protein
MNDGVFSMDQRNESESNADNMMRDRVSCPDGVPQLLRGSLAAHE